MACADRDLGGFQYVCDLRDNRSREVCFTGRYAPQETSIISRLLKHGMTFVDIGANWGYFSLLAASLVGTSGRVVSIEPDPRLFALLSDNVKANHLANVHLVQAAAAHQSGAVRMMGFDPNTGNWGVTQVDAAASGERAFTSQAITIDSHLDALGVTQVDLVKLDIEGTEDLALDGMAAGLRAGRYARLLIELHPRLLASRGVTPEQVIARLTSAGFHTWALNHSPEISRHSAYARDLDPASLLVPWKPGQQLGEWPHFLLARDRPLP